VEARKLRLDVAGLAIDLIRPAELDFGDFATRAVQFRRCAGPADLELRLSPFESEAQVPKLTLTSRHEERVEVTVSGKRSGYRLTGAELACEDDDAVVVARVDPKSPVVALENVLRVLVSRRILRRGGALLHAAALTHHGRAVLFPGVSGTGKSTVTLREPEADRISEDLVAVRRAPSGWIIESLPFYAANRLDIGYRWAPLFGIAFIRHAAGVVARRMSARTALSNLARALVSFSVAGLEALALERLVEIAAAAPAVELELDRTSTYWDALMQELTLPRELEKSWAS